MPHVALYIRDALGLEVQPGPSIPTAAVGSLPERRHVLDDDQREEAGLQWPRWWHALVTGEARLHQGADVPKQTLWSQSHEASWRTTVGEPPEFRALSDRPALRKAVITTFAEACRWAQEVRLSANTPTRQPNFAWDLTRAVAEEVAFDRGVDRGAVRGVALLLAVKGDWWVPYAPGVVLCSLPAARNAATARTILRAAFESGLSL